MTKGTFHKKIVNKAFKDLGIDAKNNHFGRDVAPAIMDMREVVTYDR